MGGIALDQVDRAILHALQEDARSTTAEEMGEEAGVSESTVRNRIEKLESSGVVRGYHPHIDYERAGYQLHLVVLCQAPPADRAALARAALGIVGTVQVREMLSGANNLHVQAVAEDSDAVDAIIQQLIDVGLDISMTDVVKRVHTQPFDHFGRSPDDGPE